MNILEYADLLLNGTSIEDKIFRCDLDLDVSKNHRGTEINKLPGRSKNIAISDEQVKFPRKGSLSTEENRGRAVHFFANHELLAIEMMAAAILKFPTLSDEDVAFKKTLLSTIADEQKHFSLYRSRMQEFGFEFGDLPLNDFFWRQMQNLETPQQFYALMALVFEQANLDFAGYYRDLFKEFGDIKTSEIMNIVYEDEIKHVALGVKWMNNWRGSVDMWQYYCDNLPGLITPSRGKGITFDQMARKRAGLDEKFIENMKSYDEGFRVTKRKEW